MSTNRFARYPGKVQVFSIGIAVMILVLAALFLGPMLSSGRDLSTPTSRLVGHWESSNDRFLTHVIYSPVDASGVGTCSDVDGSVHFTFKVLSEDRAGTTIVMREYVDGVALQDVELSVAKDGHSMAKAYDFKGVRCVTSYNYLGGR